MTLNELSSESLPSNWLFIFELEQDESYIYKKQLTDLSTNTDRFNEFELIEGTDITFVFLGDYKYTVYQMPNSSSTDETLGLLVETGKMRLIEAETPTPTFEADTTTLIYEQ